MFSLKNQLSYFLKSLEFVKLSWIPISLGSPIHIGAPCDSGIGAVQEAASSTWFKGIGRIDTTILPPNGPT